MRALVSQLDNGKSFRKFVETNAKYAKAVDNVVADGEAPEKLAAFIGRGAGRLGLVAGRQLPALSLALEAVDDDAVTRQAGEISAYLASKFRKMEDRELVTNPLGQLTTDFVEGIGALGANLSPVCIFLDTFERTAHFAEPWLQDILGSIYGEVPDSVVIGVAGQQELSRITWTADEPWIERIRLDVFTDDEANEFLGRAGLTDQRLVNEIYRISRGLPVLVATLAAQSPQSVEDIGDVTGTAIEVFLKWVDDPLRRQLAIDAAHPRILNEDTLRAIGSTESFDTDLEWLRSQPFVEERSAGWVYHEVVRGQLLRHKRKEAPSEWGDFQHALHNSYEQRQKRLQGDADRPPVHNAEWQALEVEYIYHSVCERDSNLQNALQNCVAVMGSYPQLAERMADSIISAGDDSQEPRVRAAGIAIRDVVLEEFDLALEGLNYLLDESDALPDAARPYLYRRRGILHSRSGRPEKALADANRAIMGLPGWSVLYADRAIGQLSLQEPHLALESISQGFERVGENDTLRAHLLGLRASAKLMQGHPEEALFDLGDAIELAPDDTDLRYRRGNLLIDLSQTDGAVADFASAMKTDPELTHSSLQRMGAAFLVADRIEEGEHATLESLKLEPNCVHCWDVLTEIVVERKNEDVAQVLTTPLEASLTPYGRLARAEVFAARGLFEWAILDLDTALQDDAYRGPEELMNRGLWLGYLERFGESRRTFEEILLLEPENVAAAYNLAVATVCDLSWEDAASEIGQARKLLYQELRHGTRTRAEYGLAGLAALSGRDEEALERLRAAAEFNFDSVSGWFKRDPAWNKHRQETRFKRVLTVGQTDEGDPPFE